MKIIDKNLKIGDVISINSSNGKSHNYTVVDFSQHFMRIVCLECGGTQNIHLKEEYEILGIANSCCLHNDNSFNNDWHNYNTFIKFLNPGETIFNRYKVNFVKYDIINSTCKECGRINKIYSNGDMRNYCSKNIFPKGIIPNGFCCKTAKNASTNPGLDERLKKSNEKESKKEIARKKRLADIQALEEKDIFTTETGGRLYKYNEGYIDIHSLAEIHGISEDTIRKNLKKGKTIIEAISINGILGEDIVSVAEFNDISLRSLQNLIRKGYSVEEAREMLEAESVKRLSFSLTDKSTIE